MTEGLLLSVQLPHHHRPCLLMLDHIKLDPQEDACGAPTEPGQA